MQAGRLDEALAVAQRAIVGARSCLPQHGFLASLLMKLGRAQEAGQVIEAATALPEGEADAYDGLAYVSMILGRHDQANQLYRRATQLAPEIPRFWYNLACSERSLGRLMQAEAACDRAIALDGSQYPTCLLRSELQVQTPQANHIEELQGRLRHAGDDYRARVFLGYALAKELDDVGRFDEAFHWFSTAARTRRSRLAYDVAADEAKLARIAAVYTPDVCRSGARDTRPRNTAVDSSRYLFVVGLPRSGTTLLERILTGLPGVRSNGETDNFSRALLAHGRGQGDVFQRAASSDPDEVAAGYARLARLGADDRHVVEKLPLNYLYVGAIRRALPEAQIIWIRRSPLDSCFAMYRTLFAAGYPFSYDLEELSRYYAAYAALMTHWRSILGERLHEVVYEDLVREPRRVGTALAQRLGLEWTESALEIQNNRSASLTASASQIRRPIYGTSSGRWRHYRQHLAPLICSLRRREIPVDQKE